MNTILKNIDSNINSAEVHKAQAQQVLHEYMQNLFTFNSAEEKQQFEAEMLHLRCMGVIGQLMQERNMTKKQLADALQTSKSYITQLFTADRLLNITLLARLERVFGVRFELQAVAVVAAQDKEQAG
ncbi:XRE family transcriptional regulator [Sphingobacteriales bacterium UPWRP_1]|nr:hypothetical protein BVG80_11975 [Sphingobacteriales bacterium TSM_CSM]PSJ77940.1 XRE family transcriptional regulator [Sphingobacteriales bacterium UPWRP_1]